MSFDKELTSGLIEKGLVSGDDRKKLEKYLGARDEFNNLFGPNDGVAEILNDLTESQNELREQIQVILRRIEDHNQVLEQVITFNCRIEKVAVPSLEVLNPTLKPNLAMIISTLCDSAENAKQSIPKFYDHANGFQQLLYEHEHILEVQKKSLLDLENEMKTIKKILVGETQT